MQQIHSNEGGCSRFFGGGDRRIRPHNNQLHDLKCPRCDSLNTKFCYYNNYNLSQPRHFCKSCRRYWTKGGVLRNVPIGGGCRKTKRSKAKHVPETPKERKSRSNSSSESSSLTGSTPITATATVSSAEAGTKPETGSLKCFSSDMAPFSFPESRFFVPLHTTKSCFEQNVPDIGNFTDLMMSTTNNQTALNFTDSSISAFRLNHQNRQQFQLEKQTNLDHDEMRIGFLDQTVDVSLPHFLNRSSGGDFTTFDWKASGDQGMFESTGTVDDQADQVYWNQNQWSDHDNSLYLPQL